MSENIPKNVIDVTGVELAPGEPAICLGNGEQGVECCCDECDYLMLCFLNWRTNDEDSNHDTREKEEFE